MSTLDALFESEIPSGRQALQDSYTNLQDVAAYCEDNYLKCDNKRHALEETKNYTTQALASVAYQINTLATGMLQMLDLQATQLAQMESSINHITQNVNVHKEKVARREIGVLTTSKNCPRTHKIVAPASPEKPMKYKSTPIDYSGLDSIGHGMVLSSTNRATRTPDPLRTSKRTPSISSTASTGTTESGGFAIPQPGVDTRDNRFNSLGRGGRARPPLPPAAPTPPMAYSATLPRQMPSDQGQQQAPGRTPSFAGHSHQQGPPPPMGGMHLQMGGPPAPPPEMMEVMGHRPSRSAPGHPGPMHPQGMPPPPPMQPQFQQQPGDHRMDQRMSTSSLQRMGSMGAGDQGMPPPMGGMPPPMGGQRMSVSSQDIPPPMGGQRMSVGDHGMPPPMGGPRTSVGDQGMPPPMGGQRKSFGEQGMPMGMSGQRMSVGGDQGMPPPMGGHRMSTGGFGGGVPPPPPPPEMMMGGGGAGMPPPPDVMSPPPPPPPALDMGYMPPDDSMDAMPPPPEFLQASEDPEWVPPNYVEKVVAIYDYTKEREDELSFDEGSTIYVLKKNPDGWYEGIMDGTTGLFPGNYVEAMP